MNRRIGRIENLSNNQVVYYLHDAFDNFVEVCHCALTRVRERATGNAYLISSPDNRYPGTVANLNAFMAGFQLMQQAPGPGVSGTGVRI